MILGIGTDLVDIRRISSAPSRYGDRFLHRVFTPWGKPVMRLSGAALCRLQAIVPAGLDAYVDIAIADEYPMA